LLCAIQHASSRRRRRPFPVSCSWEETMLGKFTKKWALVAGCMVAGATAAVASSGATLKAVKDRGVLNCGVSTGVQTGMSTLDSAAKWAGFEVDFCRALAAGVLGDSEK